MVITALKVIDAILAICLILSVVLQSGKSAGLSGSIAGGAETFFGGKSKGIDQVLARLTAILGIAFGTVTLILAKMINL
ncbi:preprotein translocase subunit SecG [Selenomonadales bacterium OttesenSCG-928-I06]|nr:preprotein translocase subunit SecG [Selenomonadales bacterium OttesenSCG-928-I06]